MGYPPHVIVLPILLHVAPAFCARTVSTLGSLKPRCPSSLAINSGNNYVRAMVHDMLQALSTRYPQAMLRERVDDITSRIEGDGHTMNKDAFAIAPDLCNAVHALMLQVAPKSQVHSTATAIATGRTGSLADTGIQAHAVASFSDLGIDRGRGRVAVTYLCVVSASMQPASASAASIALPSP